MRLLRPLIVLLLFAAHSAFALAQDFPTPKERCDAADPAPLTMMQFEKAEQALEPGLDYRAIFCTSAGDIYVDLYENLTPVTVNNFVFLAQQGYYDNTTFHRVIPDFMAQGGDPTGTGRGGPGYRFMDEPIGFLKFDLPFMLAMANAGPATNGSQFFITTAPTPHLNFKHTIFGDVLVGQNLVEAIRERDPSTAAEAGETLETVLIVTDAAVRENPYLSAPEPASQAEVSDVFESLAQSLPPSLPVDQELSGLYSTQSLAEAAVAEALQAGFAAFAEQYGHQYRYRLQFANGECDPAVAFSSLAYWVDVYADAASARAAAEDNFMLEWLDSYGYAQDESAPNIYRAPAAACAGEAGVHLLALYPRGRFLATLDMLVNEEYASQAPPAAILQSVALGFEQALAAIYLPEAR
jgi:peptidylprolyl isomerase/peptidyl-prolyl cis-trans isomerase B (cyclophilin B)